MADEHEISLNETIAKALWLSSMRKINSISSAARNLASQIATAGPLSGSDSEKIKKYSKQVSTFAYEPHREWK